MIERLLDYISSQGYMPHGHCYRWEPGLVWLHSGSDSLIGIAYVAIAVLLYALVRKVRLPFSFMFFAFGLFILLCGATHLFAVWNLWNADYWWSGLVKLLTAAASVATGVALVPVQPKVVELVNVARLSEERRLQLEEAHQELTSLYGRLKDQEELRTRFFANVSHELRTPLALILGPAEQLLTSGTLSAEQRRQAEGIGRNARLLVKQVDDLLQIARLEAGQAEVQPADVDLAEQVRRTASSFEAVAGARSIDLRVEAPPRLKARLDAEKVGRVLVNLLGNALKFVPSGGWVLCSLAEREENIEITVADNGPGIPPEAREAVFDRFRQLEGGATRSFGGTGLGLAIVRELVELHGGSVRLTETPGGGATFIVRLPRELPGAAELPAVPPEDATPGLEGTLVELTPAEREAAQPVSPQSDRPTVLVVEDNEEMRGFLEQVLSPAHHVVTAPDGRSGLEEALALLPDVVVSDRMMPGMSGDELLEEVRRHRELDGTAVLLLSAWGEAGDRADLLAQGAQDYLMKPFSPAELLARVANLATLTRGRRVLQEELASTSTDLESLAREVSQRRQELEAALEARSFALRQLERANMVKTTFLGMVSHELRNPLNAVSLNLQLLLRSGAAEDEAARQRLERAHSSVQQLSTLVEGLLQYTRVESGRIEPRMRPVEIVGLADQALARVRQQAEEKGLELRFRRPKPQPPPLVTDPELLAVALDNLVMNAVKFTSEGFVELEVAVAGDELSVVVTDSGPGIAEEDQGRIFDPFVQLEPLERKSIQGVGLGLALVRQISRVLGGRVDLVDSSLGVGTTFRLVLPLEGPAGEPHAKGDRS